MKLSAPVPNYAFIITNQTSAVDHQSWHSIHGQLTSRLSALQHLGQWAYISPDDSRLSWNASPAKAIECLFHAEKELNRCKDVNVNKLYMYQAVHKLLDLLSDQPLTYYLTAFLVDQATDESRTYENDSFCATFDVLKRCDLFHNVHIVVIQDKAQCRSQFLDKFADPMWSSVGPVDQVLSNLTDYTHLWQGRLVAYAPTSISHVILSQARIANVTKMLSKQTFQPGSLSETIFSQFFLRGKNSDNTLVSSKLYVLERISSRQIRADQVFTDFHLMLILPSYVDLDKLLGTSANDALIVQLQAVDIDRAVALNKRSSITLQSKLGSPSSTAWESLAKSRQLPMTAVDLDLLSDHVHLSRLLFAWGLTSGSRFAETISRLTFVALRDSAYSRSVCLFMWNYDVGGVPRAIQEGDDAFCLDCSLSDCSACPHLMMHRQTAGNLDAELSHRYSAFFDTVDKRRDQAVGGAAKHVSRTIKSVEQLAASQMAEIINKCQLHDWSPNAPSTVVKHDVEAKQLAWPKAKEYSGIYYGIQYNVGNCEASVGAASRLIRRAVGIDSLNSRIAGSRELTSSVQPTSLALRCERTLAKRSADPLAVPITDISLATANRDSVGSSTRADSPCTGGMKPKPPGESTGLEIPEATRTEDASPHCDDEAGHHGLAVRSAVAAILHDRQLKNTDPLFRPVFRRLCDICQLYGRDMNRDQGERIAFLRLIAEQNVETVLALEAKLYSTSN